MSALFRIVYAAHANGTHHKLALDALGYMERGDAEQWRRMFLKHVDVFLEGAKAPDTSFKDFKNHVLHVRDGFWGGAPEKVEAWYGHTVTALKEGDWAKAAYAAGVLSHYYTDPVMPFHTAQTEAENAIHRAAEWSINRSYDSLIALGRARHASLDVARPESPTWLKEMTCNAAQFSNRYYETLIAHYNFDVGVVRPEEGFNDTGRAAIAELLVYAATGFGRIVDRAVAEAGVAAPDVSLTLETVMAAIKIPVKRLMKRLADAEDRRVVEAMYDELKATGTVDASLPEDDRIVRDLYAREVLAIREPKAANKRALRIDGPDPAVAAALAQKSELAGKGLPPAAPAGDSAPAVARKPAAAKISTHKDAARELPALKPDPAPIATQPAPQPIAPPTPTQVTPTQAAPIRAPESVRPEPIRTEAPTIAPRATEPVTRTVLQTIEPRAASQTPPPIPVHAQSSAPTDNVKQHHEATAASISAAIKSARIYLAAGDALEAAPSIGPKMAERFAAFGITTVDDFLAQDASLMSDLLDDRRLSTETLQEWQDQARLVMTVPSLRGTHAQLLTGAGYRTREEIADADPVDFAADVLKFAVSDAGKRILRDGNAPDLERIKTWVSMARDAMAA
ncbi:MAG: DUF4332 domain-containing protein [Hyphomicrobium sp.]